MNESHLDSVNPQKMKKTVNSRKITLIYFKKSRLSSSLITFVALFFAMTVLVVVNSSESPPANSASSSSSSSSSSSPTPSSDSDSAAAAVTDLYSLSAMDVRGRKVDLKKFRGKITLVVNVASECGYTDNHYKEMVEIREILKDYDFEILAFPCNQFGSQEPAPSKMVERFVKSFYKVAFPVFHKIDVKGPEASPIFQFLRSDSGREPTWNFWKYLVDREGHVIDAWGPEVRVFELYNMIQRRLNQNKDASSSSAPNRDEL